MIDTLEADLDDSVILKFENQDPADWKAVEKANAAIKQVSKSSNPGNQWDEKFRSARHECLLSGRGTLKHTAGNRRAQDTGKVEYYSNLESVMFEDLFFEPAGGGYLEQHTFVGQQNIWRTAQDLKDGVLDDIYDKAQVKTLIDGGTSQWKMAGKWDGDMDFANRFKPLGLDVNSNNYTGEDAFNLCEWVLSYEGRKWYLVFEVYTGTWIRFEKLTDVYSSGYLPWMSFASHKDDKNFASKSFSDDLYPVADSIITLFNQDLTNRQKRNLNAKAYDKDMFKDLGKLDEAQYRPDALVPADTKGGTRRISEGVFAFETPELTGTVDLISWLEADTGKNLGVTELQQGASQAASKKVGIAYIEQNQVSKRLSFASQPFVEVGQQLGARFFNSLKDYMKEPMAIKLLGEQGIEWDLLRRIDLDMYRLPEISVTSQSNENKANQTAKANRIKALEMTAQSPNVNAKVRDEMIFREVGEFTEYDISLLMDTSSNSDKETQAEVSAAIQEIILRNKMPPLNWNADMFFLKRILDFAKKHKDTLPMKKYELLMQFADQHKEIAAKNAEEQAVDQVRMEKELAMKMGQQMPGQLQGAPQQSSPVPVQ